MLLNIQNKKRIWKRLDMETFSFMDFCCWFNASTCYLLHYLQSHCTGFDCFFIASLSKRIPYDLYFYQSESTKYLALKSSCLNAYFPPAEVKTVSLYAYRSNMSPENSTANNHDFQMHCFEETTSCKACSMLLRYFCYSIIPPTS